MHRGKGMKFVGDSRIPAERKPNIPNPLHPSRVKKSLLDQMPLFSRSFRPFMGQPSKESIFCPSSSFASSSTYRPDRPAARQR